VTGRAALRDGLRLAFVCGLSEKKLLQKLLPLTLLPEVAAVDVYRRAPFAPPPKVRQIPLTPLGRASAPAGELEKCARLLAAAPRYDAVIGCFQILHGLWAYLAGALRGVPAIQLVITDVEWNRRRTLARWPMLRAAGCGVRGEGAVAALRGLGYAGPVEIIHNPMAVPPRRDPGPGPRRDKPRDILAVGDFAAEKDYPWMLEVLGRIAARGVPFTATLCGRFPDAFRRKVREAGLADRVRFPGHLGASALADAYASSRALLMTSHTEGLPMAAVEAMAAGLPVAVTAAGELPWLVRDGRDGAVVPHGDTEAMTVALETLLTVPGLAASMGASARGRIEALAPLFTPEAVAAAWGRLLAGAGLRAGRCKL